MIANGLAVLLYRVLPVWLGWVALVIGVGTVTPVGWFGFLATMGWVLVVSIVLVVRQPVRAAETAPEEAVAAFG
jgi:hypothetical protein